MARFRLRYQSTDLDLPIGDFVIGRSSSCNLTIDDALASRRHARFVVSPEHVEVEDLGSRNGVKVNARKVRGLTRLAHLDRVVIGAQELVLLEIDALEKVDERDCEFCGASLRAGASFCSSCGNPVSRGNRTLKAGQVTSPELPVVESQQEVTVLGTDSVLNRIAEKAFALNRYDEAERMLSRKLQQMLLGAKHGVPPSSTKLAEGVRHALRLAEGTKKHAWLDWLFEIHDASEEVMEAETIERIHGLVRKLRYPGSATVRQYVQSLKARADSLSPNERFRLQRLEGLLRVIGAG